MSRNGHSPADLRVLLSGLRPTGSRRRSSRILRSPSSVRLVSRPARSVEVALHALDACRRPTSPGRPSACASPRCPAHPRRLRRAERDRRDRPGGRRGRRPRASPADRDAALRDSQGREWPATPIRQGRHRFSTKGGTGRRARDEPGRRWRPLRAADAARRPRPAVRRLRLMLGLDRPRKTMPTSLPSPTISTPRSWRLRQPRPDGSVDPPGAASPRGGRRVGRRIAAVLTALAACTTPSSSTRPALRRPDARSTRPQRPAPAVRNPEVTSLKNVRIGLETIDRLGFDRERVSLVANRVGAAGGVRRASRWRSTGEIRSCSPTTPACRTRQPGIPSSSPDPRAAFSRGIKALAALFAPTPAAERRLGSAASSLGAGDEHPRPQHLTRGTDAAAARRAPPGSTGSSPRAAASARDQHAELKTKSTGPASRGSGPPSSIEGTEELARRVRDAVAEELTRGGAAQPQRARELERQIADDILGYGPLEPFLRDPTITEIMVNGVRPGLRRARTARSRRPTPRSSTTRTCSGSSTGSSRRSAAASTRPRRWSTRACPTAAA